MVLCWDILYKLNRGSIAHIHCRSSTVERARVYTRRTCACRMRQPRSRSSGVTGWLGWWGWKLEEGDDVGARSAQGARPVYRGGGVDGGGSAKMTLTDIYVYVTIVNLLGGVLLVVGADLGASAQVASERLRLSSSRPSTPLARRSSGTGSVKAPWREAHSPFPYPIPIHPPPCIDADYRSPNHLRLLPAPWLCA